LELNKPIPRKKQYKFNPSKIRSPIHKPTKRHTPKTVYKKPKHYKNEIEKAYQDID
jgi:hypothetical protein